MSDNEKAVPVEKVVLTAEAVTDIMSSVFSECSEFVCVDTALIPQGVPAGEWAAKQILAGEAVRFYATETPPGTPDPRCWDVTLEKLRAGVWRYLTAGLWFLLDDGVLDAELLEPEDTVPIIVFAMFEDGSAGKEECV